VTDHVATAEAEIDASPAKVWTALTDPEQIKQYMFGSRVETDWKQGKPDGLEGRVRAQEVRGQG
jgi:uncharacterized protein YndB with AHSA1/START domain